MRAKCVKRFSFARLLTLATIGSFFVKSMSDTTSQPSPAEALGLYLKSARTALAMSLRDVEEATDKQVSNAYLSQLENGKIAKPSPHILHALSGTYHIGYEKLMERAGYLPSPLVGAGRAATKHGKIATCSIEHLTPSEEKALRNYLDFWRQNNPRENIR
jgi:transcriptional regulator with XRE-family HTH domain